MHVIDCDMKKQVMIRFHTTKINEQAQMSTCMCIHIVT